MGLLFFSDKNLAGSLIDRISVWMVRVKVPSGFISSPMSLINLELIPDNQGFFRESSVSKDHATTIRVERGFGPKFGAYTDIPENLVCLKFTQDPIGTMAVVLNADEVDALINLLISVRPNE
jgi:hypothetical protein